jgi:exopolysaccharide biosynthesis polyprenyl glycosylphosphotransferase
VRVSANISDILSTRLSLQQVGGLMALSLRPVRLSGAQAVAKRSLDLVLASLSILLLAPLWLILAVAIKLDSRGPVFFRQKRIGRHEQPFEMLKFRTMVNGADLMLDDLRDQNEATGPLFKLRRDPRVTRVGRFLRRWSLDELPQIWNVLEGNMSLVGPRPPLPDEVALYEDWHLDRLEVPPGMTGLWQIKGRSDLPFDDYVRLDLFYIENWSIGYDLYIMAKTLPAVFAGRGAF